MSASSLEIMADTGSDKQKTLTMLFSICLELTSTITDTPSMTENLQHSAFHFSTQNTPSQRIDTHCNLDANRLETILEAKSIVAPSF